MNMGKIETIKISRCELFERIWSNPDRPNLTIQNTMRRIVEKYLTVLGGLKQEEIVALFEGRDAQICQVA